MIQTVRTRTVQRCVVPLQPHHADVMTSGITCAVPSHFASLGPSYRLHLALTQLRLASPRPHARTKRNDVPVGRQDSPDSPPQPPISTYVGIAGADERLDSFASRGSFFDYSEAPELILQLRSSFLQYSEAPKPLLQCS